MDKQEIIDYVTTSPTNTNPSVLNSLLDQYGKNIDLTDYATKDYVDVANELLQQDLTALLPKLHAGNDYGCTNDADAELLEVSGAAKVWHLKPNSIHVFYSVQWDSNDPENTGLGLYATYGVEPSPTSGKWEWFKDANKVQGSKMYIIFTGSQKFEDGFDGFFPYLVLYQSNKTEEYRMLKGYGYDSIGQLAVVSMGGTADTKCADVVALNL